MPKESLKDKIDGNELDLSLSSLEIVPVAELAALPKATHLDLSCNLLTTLSDNFCTLQHLIRLDLSKNQLRELPYNFGNLKKLQYLDLYNNKLKTLPVSFFKLKSLKWLDLKDNPLREQLKAVAGDCLDEKQCKACSKRVIDFMTNVQAEQERQNQKKLQEERELKAKQKAEEEKEKQRVREERKREKDKRRREHEAKIQQQKREEQERLAHMNAHAETNGSAQNTVGTEVKKRKSTSGLSCCGVMLAVFVGLTAVLVGLFFYCSSHANDQACIQANILLEKYKKQAQTLINKYLQK